MHTRVHAGVRCEQVMCADLCLHVYVDECGLTLDHKDIKHDQCVSSEQQNVPKLRHHFLTSTNLQTSSCTYLLSKHSQTVEK